MKPEQRKLLTKLVEAAQEYGFVRGRGVDNEASVRQHRENLSVAYETYREAMEKYDLVVYKPPS